MTMGLALPAERMLGAAPMKTATLPKDAAENTKLWQETHFRHYAELANQQNMLEDTTRTGAYHDAFLHNRADFEGKVVLDVGAGSGILSLFAARAGAARVYAVEATAMAENARTLVAANGLAGQVTVLRGDIAEVEVPEAVDTIVSEPLGVFLFHEGMLDAYVTARDRFLRPGGRMFPESAKLYVAPFTDADVFHGWQSWARFWEQKRFFGCDLSALASFAFTDAFAMPVVGPMAAEGLLAAAVCHPVDFLHVSHEALARVEVPFAFELSSSGTLHGLGSWFTASLSGSVHAEELSTAPNSDRTHWYQTRFLFSEPVPALAGQKLVGRLTASKNVSCSYDVRIEAQLEGSGWQVDQRYELERHRYWWGK